LCVIPGAGGDDAARTLTIREVRDFVVRAAKLEAEDGLQVFALEQDLVAETLRKPRRRVERGLARNIVNAARQYVVEQLGQFGGHEHNVMLVDTLRDLIPDRRSFTM